MFGKGKGKDKVATKLRTPSDGDDLGPFPADVNSEPTQQRVLERALRNVTIIAVVLGVINFAMVLLLIAVFPLKQVYPYLVTFRDKDQQVVAIEPLSTDAPGIQYATEDNVRDYVQQRHSFAPNNTRMDAQWGPDSRLAAMTTTEEFNQFTNSAALERTRLMTGGYTRQVEIESANMLRPDTWQVNFETIDSLGGSGGTLTANPQVTPGSGSIEDQQNLLNADLTPQSVRKRWVATMTIEYQPQNVSYENRLLNPLGFTVTDYSVTARN